LDNTLRNSLLPVKSADSQSSFFGSIFSFDAFRRCPPPPTPAHADFPISPSLGRFVDSPCSFSTPYPCRALFVPIGVMHRFFFFLLPFYLQFFCHPAYAILLALMAPLVPPTPVNVYFVVWTLDRNFSRFGGDPLLHPPCAPVVKRIQPLFPLIFREGGFSNYIPVTGCNPHDFCPFSIFVTVTQIVIYFCFILLLNAPALQPCWLALFSMLGLISQLDCFLSICLSVVRSCSLAEFFCTLVFPIIGPPFLPMALAATPMGHAGAWPPQYHSIGIACLPCLPFFTHFCLDLHV